MSHCEICNIHTPQGLSWKQHVNGKKHQNKLAKHQAALHSFILFVTGLPLEMTDAQLKAHFEKLPSVMSARVDRKQNDYATLRFKNVKLKEAFARQKHVLGKHELTVHLSYPGRACEAPKPSAPDLDPDTMSQMKALKDVPSQIELLVERIALPAETLNERLKIYKMLENVMKKFFPNCSVVPYGSCANGLGMNNSDLDIFMDLKVDFLGQEGESADHQMKLLQNFTPVLECYRRQKPGFLNYQFLERVKQLSSRMAIRLVNSIIRLYGTECIQLFCIPHARCPIVSFVHRPTKIHCDVSIENGLAVHNTVLVRFFQQLDPRVRFLLMTIRFWAKQMELVDPKKCRFSSYAITMLTIFYLQNCTPPILPTLEALQELTDTKTMCYGWECQFCMEAEKIPKTTNVDGLNVLLAGFFEFYTQHNLDQVALCLRTGKVGSKSHFVEYIKSQENLSDFKVSLFNIQDVFELNFNTARGVNEAGQQRWHLAIAKAHEICSKKGPAWDLASLLFAKLEEPSERKKGSKMSPGKQIKWLRKLEQKRKYQQMADIISSTPALLQSATATTASLANDGGNTKKRKNK